MKVLHVSHSDVAGGAAIAARRLHAAQRAAGIQSSMMVVYRQGNDPWTQAPLGAVGRVRTRAARFVAKRIAGAFDSGASGMQSLGLVATGLGAAIDRSDADLVHLHWVGGEALSLGEIGRIRKPLVWTLHDQWALRGSVHYGDGRAEEAPGIDGWTWRRKRRLWQSLSVSLVCPSRWLAAQAMRQAPFHVRQVDVIPYTLDSAVFRPGDTRAARAALGLPQDAQVLLFGAERAATDARKGFDLLESALAALRHRRESKDLVLAVFGADDGRDVAGLPTRWLGRLRSEADVARACACADAFVAPSRADNLPNTVLEALFCNLPCVAFDVGGFPDMIEQGTTGFLAEPFEPEALATAIEAALAMPHDRRALIRPWALARFGSAEIVRRHVTLYDRVLSEAASGHSARPA